jgi:hypothetical protein
MVESYGKGRDAASDTFRHREMQTYEQTLTDRCKNVNDATLLFFLDQQNPLSTSTDMAVTVGDVYYDRRCWVLHVALPPELADAIENLTKGLCENEVFLDLDASQLIARKSRFHLEDLLRDNSKAVQLGVRDTAEEHYFNKICKGAVVDAIHSEEQVVLCIFLTPDAKAALEDIIKDGRCGGNVMFGPEFEVSLQPRE